MCIHIVSPYWGVGSQVPACLPSETSCFSKVTETLMGKLGRKEGCSPAAFGMTKMTSHDGPEAGLWSDCQLRHSQGGPRSGVLLHVCPCLPVKWAMTTCSRGRKERPPLSRPSTPFYFSCLVPITLVWRPFFFLKRVQTHEH